ncbi:Uncharacterized protein FWK35_00018189 [Aphis craccivora]|uniref:Uncharacterized protein n=1 Tax=Aphis craccivora TaxID=307492 RepID=A0A6G0YFN1_APHCR|nr:Uncharacterized protein FWK35_00018189 [Aphis craccivora]
MLSAEMDRNCYFNFKGVLIHTYVLTTSTTQSNAFLTISISDDHTIKTLKTSKYKQINYLKFASYIITNITRPTDTGKRLSLPQLPFGIYRLNFLGMLRCESIKYDVHLSKKSANTTEVVGNVTNSIPLDDSLNLEFNLAVKDSIGGWKENAFFYKSPKACSTLIKFMGPAWTKMMHSAGYHNATCPMPVVWGFYKLSGVDTGIFMEANFPKSFFYGTYKFRIMYTKNNEVCACFIFVVECLLINFIFFVVFVNSDTGKPLSFPQLPYGVYRLNFKGILRCHPPGKKSANTTEFKGNITNLVPFDDSFDIDFNLAVKDSIGGWKENAFLYKSSKACSTLKNFLGPSWTVLMDSAGYPNATCPFPKGYYKLNGIDTDTGKPLSRPQLPYGIYRLNFKGIIRCNPTSKKSANTTEIKGNITNLVPFDDSLDLEFNLAVKDSIGGWKENAFLYKSPKACSSLRKFLGAAWIPFMDSLGNKNGTCPFPKDIYIILSGIDTNVLMNGNFPKTLRSTLSQNILTPLMLISIEKDITENINKEDIINEISKSSMELKRLLQ